MKLLLLIFCLLILTVSVNAVGLGVAPAELSFNVEKGKKQQKEITVYNLEDVEIQFEVKANADFLEFYHNGVIESSSMAKIVVEADARSLDEGTYNSLIYITTLDDGVGLKLSAGTAVKVDVHVFSENKLNVAMGIMTSFVTLLIGLMFYFVIIKTGNVIAVLVKE